MSEHATIDHGQGRLGASLRRNRARVVLVVVLVEGLLVLADAIPWWAVLLLAAGAFAFYVGNGRQSRRALVREASWVAAVSQLVVVLVPVLAVVLTALAVVVLVIVAIALLALVLLDRH
jgi:hypothetical protein